MTFRRSVDANHINGKCIMGNCPSNLFQFVEYPQKYCVTSTEFSKELINIMPYSVQTFSETNNTIKLGMQITYLI